MKTARLGALLLLVLSNCWACADAYYTQHYYLNLGPRRTYTHDSAEKGWRHLAQRKVPFTSHNHKHSHECRIHELDVLTLFAEVSGDGFTNLPRESRLRENYKILSIGYGLIAAIVFLMPDKTFTARLASKFGGAAGFGLAAGISRVMVASIDNNRLTSETCKRLNVGLLGFSILGLFAVPGEAGFLPKAAPAMVLTAMSNIVRLFGAFVAYTGWSNGVLRSSPVQQTTQLLLSPKQTFMELCRGIKVSFMGMRVLKVNKKKSLMYRNSVLLVLFGLFSSFMEGLFHIRYASALNKTVFDSSLQWSAVARLFLLSTMIFSLKDAAERDRLKGSTFIQLNLMVGAWALLVWIGQGLTLTGFSTKRIEMMAFSLLFLIRGLKFQKFKSDDRKARLLHPPAVNELPSGDVN